jgi:CubicO group peptidase (beta-lactamase class C family)
MKTFFLFFVLSTSYLFLSCSDINNTEEQPIGYGWQSASPEQLGMNSIMLTNALNASSAKGFINSVLVIRNGKIAAEKHFNGRNANSYQSIKSVSKSFLSALVGIAVSKGIMSLDQRMIDSFPEYQAFVTDINVNNITLRHLLTMRSGIKGDEEFYSVFTNSNNWIKTIIQSPLKFAPGTGSLYSTASTHLVSGMLTKASGMSAMEFAKINLFDPMGIVINDWARDPQGIYFGGNNMIMTTRNMAVLGLLYLNKGNLNGRQIVPEGWVNNSLVYSGGVLGTWGALSEIGYGYLWWLGKASGKNIFTAIGHGGQFVLCVPDYNLIAAVNSNPLVDWDDADEQERAALQIIADYVIPAVMD